MNPSTTVDITVMGIADMREAISTHQITLQQAVATLDQRIAKRKQTGRSQIPGVIKARNEWASLLNLPPIDLPTYTKTPRAQLVPSQDIDELAEQIVSNLGRERVADLIARLMAACAK